MEEQMKKRLLERLPTGEKSAIRESELLRRWELQDGRQLRSIIHSLRTSGDELILSSSRGYFKAESVEEATRFIHRMDSMATATREAANSARAFLRERQAELSGQLSFFL